jgi:hypothetical protein
MPRYGYIGWPMNRCMVLDPLGGLKGHLNATNAQSEIIKNKIKL